VSFFLSGCETITVVDSVALVSEKVDRVMGFKGAEYRLPNYYSTRQIPQKYVQGQTYYIDDLK